MTELDRMQKEANNELFKNNLLAFYNNNRQKLLISLVLGVIILISTMSYIFYVDHLTKKYSLILQKSFIEEEIDYKLVNEVIDQNYSNGLKLLSSLQYAKFLIEDKKIDDAVKLYLSVNENEDNDQFFREYAGLVAIKHMMNLEVDADNFLAIINKIESSSLIIRSYITEQKAIYFWKNKEFDEAKEVYNFLINDIEVPLKVKDRAKMMLEVAFI